MPHPCVSTIKGACTFEDDGNTGYLYLQPADENGELFDIIDAIWVYTLTIR
jgi:hypothetical protein